MIRKALVKEAQALGQTLGLDLEGGCSGTAPEEQSSLKALSCLIAAHVSGH